MGPPCYLFPADHRRSGNTRTVELGCRSPGPVRLCLKCWHHRINLNNTMPQRCSRGCLSQQQLAILLCLLSRAMRG